MSTKHNPSEAERNAKLPTPAFFPNLERKSIGVLLDRARPISWIWLTLALALAIGGNHVIGAGWSQIGFKLLTAWFCISLFGCFIAIVLDMPSHCSFGHNDLGFFYGRWSCRTCYRLARRHRRLRGPHGVAE